MFKVFDLLSEFRGAKVADATFQLVSTGFQFAGVMRLNSETDTSLQLRELFDEDDREVGNEIRVAGGHFVQFVLIDDGHGTVRRGEW